ncbi:MAG: ABC transporter substrate-binding protein [Rhodoglobus sp.]
MKRPTCSRRVAQAAGALAVIALAAPLLAGCGAAGGDEPAANKTPPPLGAGMSQEFSDFLATAAKPYAGTTVNVLAISSAQSAAMEAIKGEFEDVTGINVNVTSVAENDLVTKAQVTLSSGSPGFDVLQTLSFFVPSYAQNDWLLPVDELSNDTDITYPGLDTSAYAPSAVGQLTYADELWAMPMFVATQVFYYRTDIFKQYDVKVPTTMEELVKVIETIDSDEVPAIAMRAASGSTQNLFPWTSWLYNSGGSYYGKLDSETGQYSDPSLDSPEAVAAAELYAKMLQEHGPSGALNWTVADVTRAFLSGQVAMIQEGSPFGGTINDPAQSAVAGEVGAFAMPAGDAGSYYPSAAQGWGINRYSENAEASWLFSQWATDPGVLLEASLASQFPAPPLTTVFRNPDFRAKYDFPGFLDSLETSLSGETSPIGGSYIPALLDWQATGQQVSVEFNKVINGQEDAKDALTEANKYLESAIK